MNETFEQFVERMSKIEKIEEYTIGQAHRGDTRAIFEFEGQHCYLESRGFRRMPERQTHPATPAQMFYIASANPYDWWSHSHLIYGKDRVSKMMKHYGAISFEEDPYPREEDVWFYLNFRDFEDLMKIVWDIHTGAFKELWGDEPKDYESCIGYMEDKNENE